MEQEEEREKHFEEQYKAFLIDKGFEKLKITFYGFVSPHFSFRKRSFLLPLSLSLLSRYPLNKKCL